MSAQKNSSSLLPKSSLISTTRQLKGMLPLGTQRELPSTGTKPSAPTLQQLNQDLSMRALPSKHTGWKLVAQGPNLAPRNVFVCPAKCCLNLKHYKQFRVWHTTPKKLSYCSPEDILKNIQTHCYNRGKKLKSKSQLEPLSSLNRKFYK